ncbi:hypothetical protein L2737_17845, partial [Shewanella electrodiphila]|nr:hypothetical protein [Shewanella electrodiphila]
MKVKLIATLVSAALMTACSSTSSSGGHSSPAPELPVSPEMVNPIEDSKPGQGPEGNPTTPDLPVASNPIEGAPTTPDLPIASNPIEGVPTAPDLPIASNPIEGAPTTPDLPADLIPDMPTQGEHQIIRNGDTVYVQDTNGDNVLTITKNDNDELVIVDS